MNWIKTTGLLLFTLLSACDSNEPANDLQQFANQLKHVEANKLSKTIAIPLSPSVTYQADNLRSPFQEPALPTAPVGSISSPLQAYPLTTLRFAGTVTQANNISIAYILTPDNMIYQVKEGDTIGDHHGKVTRIQSDRLMITEQDSENKNQAKRVITLQLKDIH